jgi:hypothetical protein
MKARNFTKMVILVGIVAEWVVASPTMAASRMHAKATICAQNGCSTAGDCKPQNGVAHAEETANTGFGIAKVVAHEQQGYNYITVSVPVGSGYSGSGHAHRHGSFFCIPFLNTLNDNMDQLNGPGGPRDPGSPGSNANAAQTYAAGGTANTVDVTFDPAAYLQVDASALAIGKSISASWTLEITEERSTVNLVATKRKDGSVVVVPSFTGVFRGPAYTVTPTGNQLYVLQFTQPLQWTVPGDVDTIDIGVEGSVTPADANPIKCREAIAKASSKFVQSKMKALSKCEGNLVAGRLPGGTDCHSESQTAAAIATAMTKLHTDIAKNCGGADRVCGAGGDDASLISIGWGVSSCPDLENKGCTNAIANCNDIADCLACVGEQSVDQLTSLYYHDLDLGSPSGSALEKCQLTIGKVTAKFFAAKSKALQKCWNSVSNGSFPGPCPLPGDGKAQAAIAKAESKKVVSICKACGGADKVCGGSDDFTPAQIGFAATCPAVTVPGPPPVACGLPITTLTDMVACVDCVTEFKVDCVDSLAVPWGNPYPPQCNPGCGNNLVEAPEECDGTDDAACPGQCVAPPLANACTCQ